MIEYVELVLTLWVSLLAITGWMCLGSIFCYLIDPNHIQDDPDALELLLLYLCWPVIIAISFIEMLNSRGKKYESNRKKP